MYTKLLPQAICILSSTVTGLFTRCSGGTGILIGYLIPNYIPPSPINFSPPAEQIYIYFYMDHSKGNIMTQKSVIHPA